MSPKIQTLLILGCACISLTVMAADETTDRVERSMAVFAKGLDTLLLETPHVFIKQGDIVDTIYIPDVGVVFIGRISMTEGANVSILLNDWSNWFENISNHVDSS